MARPSGASSSEAGFNRHLVNPIGGSTLEELVKSAAGA
jgi:hypothetical protein